MRDSDDTREVALWLHNSHKRLLDVNKLSLGLAIDKLKLSFVGISNDKSDIINSPERNFTFSTLSAQMTACEKAICGGLPRKLNIRLG